ncbi:CUB and sushi domain-containing protein 3-like isoform X2 [Rana temporaria]|uniref:CUB and sushi domain-containing protein 3-like isoform X2 n=1 Tax=Rana temporaria TaxID=8407 RepID=UPI001AACCBAF|nr:CUB and sushi domain-containing protein 3-like isoform X2 [Rana temporaria]XP_040195463.1 CUB and sushi domain-containing protein 3-like isoform X2 [Rana temporaria]
MTLGPYTLEWAFTFLLCFALFNGAWGDCGPPPVKPNTNPIKETSGTTGQTVVYTCDRSTSYYEIPGKSTTITCQADSTWTNIEDFCSRACGLPKRISYAEPKPGALNQNIFLPNATVSYGCRPGYTRVTGKKSLLTCLEDYTWSEPEVFCQRRSCGNPGEVENGNMEATDFLFGSRVTYTCNEGYRLVSRRNFRDCQVDGIWSNVLPQCDAVICPAPELPADGKYDPQKDEYNYLDSVTFSCQKPLQVAGNASISCTATGKWSSDSPTCKAVNCPNPDVKDSRRLSGFIGPYTLNSAISFDCKKGFILRGSGSISCNIDSQWVPTIPQCERISCGDPGTIQNGQISAPDFYVDSKATYTCNEGFAFPLTSLRNYRICQENGAWSDLTLVCTATCKANFHIPPFALLNGTSTIYYNGTVVRFECKPGFNTSNGKENTITCRDHSWLGPEEFCTRISCGDPGKIMNGHVSASDNLFGSRAIYTCEKGYVMNTTQNFTECQADGTWSTAIGCKECETCGDGEQEDKPEECETCRDMEQGDKPEDASKSEGIGIRGIVGICCGIISAPAVAAVGYLIYKHLSKKRKTGEYYCDVKTDEPEL